VCCCGVHVYASIGSLLTIGILILNLVKLINKGTWKLGLLYTYMLSARNLTWSQLLGEKGEVEYMEINNQDTFQGMHIGFTI